jgi:hypothetical protein
MITKFIRKRNVNTNLPFSKSDARIQVHASGDHTFKFRKRSVSTGAASRLLTEANLFLTTESGLQIAIE